MFFFNTKENAMRIAMWWFGFILCACGTNTVVVKRKIETGDGKELGTIDVSSSETDANDAAQLIDAARRYEESARGGDVAVMSVERGIPVTLSTAGATVSTGGYYTTGQYAGFSDAYAPFIAAERLTYGVPSRGQLLPTLQSGGSQAPAQGLPDLEGNGKEPCPRDRVPITDAQRISCAEEHIKFLNQQIMR